jgi:hypothetical protein
MSRRLLGIGLFACVVAALGGSTSCVHNDQSWFIKHVQFPPDDCVFKPDPSLPFINTGAVDVALATNYDAVFLTGNQLIARGEKVTVRAESARITAKGAVVSVRFADGRPFAGGGTTREYTTLTSATVDPDTASTATYGVVGAILIDPKTMTELQQSLPNRGQTSTIVATVKLFGETLGHTDVETNEFEFPIIATNGGLVSFPPEADDLTVPGRDCLLPRAGGAGGAAKKICSFGQDVVVDCRDCQGNPVCDRP